MEKSNIGKKGGGSGGGGGTKTIKNASTQVLYQKKKKEEQPKTKTKTKLPSQNYHHGQKIGRDLNDERWQCKICSFKNAMEIDVCSMCDSQKGEEKAKH